MRSQSPQGSSGGEPLGSPQPERGGPTIDEAVDAAEEGSRVEGEHTPSGGAASGESRAERMPDVEGVTEGRQDGSDGEADAP